jgi:hypothetical protein
MTKHPTVSERRYRELMQRFGGQAENACSERCGYCGRCTAGPEPERPTCLWCGDEIVDPWFADDVPYCSPLCSARAERDSEER